MESGGLGSVGVGGSGEWSWGVESGGLGVEFGVIMMSMFKTKFIN